MSKDIKKILLNNMFSTMILAIYLIGGIYILIRDYDKYWDYLHFEDYLFFLVFVIMICIIQRILWFYFIKLLREKNFSFPVYGYFLFIIGFIISVFFFLFIPDDAKILDFVNLQVAFSIITFVLYLILFVDVIKFWKRNIEGCEIKSLGSKFNFIQFCSGVVIFAFIFIILIISDPDVIKRPKLLHKLYNNPESIEEFDEYLINYYYKSGDVNKLKKKFIIDKYKPLFENFEKILNETIKSGKKSIYVNKTIIIPPDSELNIPAGFELKFSKNAG